MIRKLKIKIIVSTMSLVTLMLIGAFICMYVITSQSIATDSIRAMESAMNKPSIGIFAPDNGTERRYLSVITIDLNETDNTFSIDGYSVSVYDLSEEDVDYINTLINAVKADGGEKGEIASDDYNYRYIAKQGRMVSRIVLLDKQYETNTLSSLMFTLLNVGALLFVGFLILTIFIAKAAVAPAEKSWKQQKQLVADASHELKTPLTVISANTDIVLSNPDATVEEQKKWLGYIKAETERMAQLINNMLFLAKSDDGYITPTLTPLNLSAVVNEVALPFESVCFEKNRNFTVNIAQNIFVKGDSPSLKQLVAILLDNAVKYSNENGHIELCLLCEGEKAELVVRNSGEPISKENLDKIFERFYRVNKARSRSEGGYGLGLSIAKTVTHIHGGKITVTSNPIDGTIFKCTFKRIKNI